MTVDPDTALSSVASSISSEPARFALAALFAVKTIQGAVLLFDLPGVPDVTTDGAVRSIALTAICVGLLVWRSGILTWSTGAAVALLSLVSNAADFSPPVWSAFSIATSVGILVLTVQEVRRVVLRRGPFSSPSASIPSSPSPSLPSVPDTDPITHRSTP